MCDGAGPKQGWAFGRRRGAGLLGWMGTVGDCSDKSGAESFFGTLQLELLDEHRRGVPPPARSRVFVWTEDCHNTQAAITPKRRQSHCDMLSPVEYEAAHAA